MRWAIEGDENSIYFHGIINKRRRQQGIKGVFINGDWVVRLDRVKGEFFFSHFASQFSKPSTSRFCLIDDFLNRLSVEQGCSIEEEITREEIKRAVWDCSSDKSLGPDGFTFAFFKKYWHIVE